MQAQGETSSHSLSSAIQLVCQWTLIEQKPAGFGVKIDSAFCGTPMYADELISSPQDLQAMLDIESLYATK